MASFMFDENGDLKLSDDKTISTTVKNNYKETIYNELKLSILEDFVFFDDTFKKIYFGKRISESDYSVVEKEIDNIILKKINNTNLQFLKKKVAIHGQKMLILFYYDDGENQKALLSKSINL